VGFRLTLARREVAVAGGTSVADQRQDPLWNFAQWREEERQYPRRGGAMGAAGGKNASSSSSSTPPTPNPTGLVTLPSATGGRIWTQGKTVGSREERAASGAGCCTIT
jgi:hypothetical protein